MVKTNNRVKEFAFIAFTLLGVLFGMMIMTFIFGQLGNSAAASIDDSSANIVNETDAHANLTGYTVVRATVPGFNTPVITAAFNATDGGVGSYNLTIPLANLSISSSGVVTNATDATYDNISLSYSYLFYSDVRVASNDVQNNSIQAIVTYTNQSDTQFTTVAIAITLVVLIAVFLLFWGIFVSQKRRKNKSEGNFM